MGLDVLVPTSLSSSDASDISTSWAEARASRKVLNWAPEKGPALKSGVGTGIIGWALGEGEGAKDLSICTTEGQISRGGVTEESLKGSGESMREEVEPVGLRAERMLAMWCSSS
jgi:hypothetical protein